MSDEIQKVASVGPSQRVRVLRIVFVAALVAYILFLMRSFGFL